MDTGSFTGLYGALAADEWLDGGEQKRKPERMRKDNKRITPENAAAQIRNLR